MVKLLTFAAILTAATTLPVFAAPDPPTDRIYSTARVRAADTRTANLLVQGLQRSSTLRGLVDQLERHDVIVYIEMQPMMKKRLAGTLTWLTATKAHRYVRISINPELNTEMAIATLGHELQHALEVAKAGEIVNAVTLANFYRAHGESNPAEFNGWDTEAARVAGQDVRRELAAWRAGRVADSIQQLDPNDWLVVYRRTRSMLPP